MATRMYPNKDYGVILQQHFDQHGLILDPIELVITNAIEQQSGSVPFNLALDNVSVSKLEQISLSFSDLPQGIKIKGDISPISQLLAGENRRIDGQFTFELGDNLSCGQKLTIPVDVKYTSDIAVINHSRLALSLTIGVGNYHATTGNGGPLKDAIANDVGLSKKLGVNNFYLDFRQDDLKISQQLILSLVIENPQFDQLSIKLISPSGQHVEIWDRQYYPRQRFEYTLPNNVASIDWSPVINESLSGHWQLQIIDHDAGQAGQLLSWGLSQVIDYSCRQPDVSTPEKPITNSKPSKSAGGFGWVLLLLGFAYITRKHFYTEK